MKLRALLQELGESPVERRLQEALRACLAERGSDLLALLDIEASAERLALAGLLCTWAIPEEGNIEQSLWTGNGGKCLPLLAEICISPCYGPRDLVKIGMILGEYIEAFPEKLSNVSEVLGVASEVLSFNNEACAVLKAAGLELPVDQSEEG